MGSISPSNQEMEGFVLGEAVPEDFEAFAKLQAFAMKVDPLMKVLMKDVTQENLDAFMLQLLHVRLERPGTITYKITETATNKIVSYFIMHPPHIWTEEELARPRSHVVLPEGCIPELGEYFLSDVQTIRNRNGYNPEKDYCGMAIGTLPDYQGRGFAERMVQIAVDMQDRDQTMYYATVRPAAWKLYEKLGFEQYKQTEVDLSKWGGGIDRTRLMIRYPKPLGSGQKIKTAQQI